MQTDRDFESLGSRADIVSLMRSPCKSVPALVLLMQICTCRSAPPETAELSPSLQKRQFKLLLFRFHWTRSSRLLHSHAKKRMRDLNA